MCCPIKNMSLRATHNVLFNKKNMSIRGPRNVLFNKNVQVKKMFYMVHDYKTRGNCLKNNKHQAMTNLKQNTFTLRVVNVSCFGFRYCISDRVIIRQKFILV